VQIRRAEPSGTQIYDFHHWIDAALPRLVRSPVCRHCNLVPCFWVGPTGHFGAI